MKPKTMRHLIMLGIAAALGTGARLAGFTNMTAFAVIVAALILIDWRVEKKWPVK